MRHKDYEHVRSGSPLEYVAVGIITNAVRSWRYWKDRQTKPVDLKSHRYAEWQYARALGYYTPRDELLDFFHSQHFEELCDFVGPSICPRQIRAHLGMENMDIRHIELQLELMGT